jgi:hypothetical protein
MKWHEYCREAYPDYFNDCSVLEMGSLNYNGSVRQYFTNCTYTGVDWTHGLGVDIVSLAHEVEFRNMKFKTIISASMLEHDPYWERSLVKMIDLLDEDGGLFLNWGGEGSIPHCRDSAPDKKYHPLKSTLVFDFLENKGLYIHEFGNEAKMMNKLGFNEIDKRIAKHCYVLIGFKHEKYPEDERVINV